MLTSTHKYIAAGIGGTLLVLAIMAIFLSFASPRNTQQEQTNLRATAEQPSQAEESDQRSETDSGKEGEKGNAKKADETDKDAAEQKKTDWDRPRFQERHTARQRMVSNQIENRGVDDGDVLNAMLRVPRHKFVPSRHASSAYRDQPLPIGHGQTISQPHIVALMTDLLDIKTGDKVLEIGTGSAYQAAVLSELTPHVYTIEIIEALAEQAGQRLDELGYDTIEVKADDGYFGWERHAPFDAILVTAAAGHIPPPLLEQLKNGGRMIIPVGGVYEVQHLVLVKKGDEGDVTSKQLTPVRFVPMTGRAQEGE